MRNCLPACRFIPYRELFADRADALSGFEDEFLDTAGVRHHDENCPELAKLIKRGRELAKQHGWLDRERVRPSSWYS